MEIYVNYLGSPHIFLDNKQVKIPQKKILALLLYLLHNNHCTRDELIGVFWSYYSEDSARQNLRNSLYKLKQILGENIIQTQGNSIIEINPEIRLEKDLNILVTENHNDKLLTFSSFVFLDTFFLKDCEEFDQWVLSFRAIYEKLSLVQLEKAMKDNYQLRNMEHSEAYAKKVLTLSPYNENAAQTLLQTLATLGKLSKAEEFYTSFSELLEKDLGVSPQPATEQIYQNLLVLKQISRKPITNSSAFLHDENHQILNKQCDQFRNQKPYRNILLYGALCSKMPELIQDFLQASAYHSLLFSCHISDRSLTYHGLDRLIMRLYKQYGLPLSIKKADNISADSYYSIVFDTLSRYMKQNNHKEILIIEELQFMDEKSIKLLFSVLLEYFQGNIFFLASYTTTLNENSELLQYTKLLPRLECVNILPLSDKHIMGTLFSETALEKHAANSPMQNNNFFLKNIIKNIETEEEFDCNINELAQQKLGQLQLSFTELENACVNLLCFMEYGSEIEAIIAFSEYSFIKIINTIESLKFRGIVSENHFGGHNLININSFHLKKSFYDRLSSFYQTELHHKLAIYYKDLYKTNFNDFFYLWQTNYHYQKTNFTQEKLYYNILEFQYRLDYIDEFFPITRGSSSLLQIQHLSKHEIYKILDQFFDELENIGTDLPPEKFDQLYMILNYLKGRALNRDGHVEKGVVYISKMMQIAATLGEKAMLFSAYLEMARFGHKTENWLLMQKNIEKARAIAGYTLNEMQQGVLLRLEGLSHIMTQKYDIAEIKLTKAIELFESPRYKSSNYINSAAVYDYLGILYRAEGKFKKSQEYIQKAIEICLIHHVEKSLDLFFEDLGYTLFLAGDYSQAKHYFLKSMKLYDTYGTYWLRSIGESCLALIYLREDKSDKALEHYRRAEIFSKKDGTTEELTALKKTREELQKHKVI